MDLDEFQKSVTQMSGNELDKQRADLNEGIRKAKRSTTLHYDERQLSEFQTLEVKLHVVQTEITRRTESKS